MAITINGTTGVAGVDGSASAPAVQGSDTNTGLSFASDTVNINTGGSTRATIDSSGKLIVGSTDDYAENVQAAFYGASNGGIALASGTSGLSRLMFADATSGNAGAYVGSIIYAHSDNSLRFNVNNGTERMRILSGGSITTNGNTSLPTGSTSGFGFSTDQFYLSYTGTGANYSQRFYNGNGLVGSILVNGSSTTYNTSSDYRLKENVVTLSDGITRLKQLKPYKFNFIADASTTFDGFFAHEAQAVVPESATGVKDEVESQDNTETNTKKGDPIYQGIDQSKLVPLLTAALQEAIAKIEVLETKVAALEAG